MPRGTRTALTTLMAFVVSGAAGCGGDQETATTTVTAPAATVTVTGAAATASPPSGSSGATGAPESAGPLPAGVVGIDGRYVLEAVKSDFDGQEIGSRFFSYEEPSNAATTCSGGTCSVELRLGLRSGGSKAYTLAADPERAGTYVGTSKGEVKCAIGDLRVPSRERVAVRAGSPADVGGRQVAGRLGVYITTTARCDDEPARSVVTLRGPREP